MTSPPPPRPLDFLGAFLSYLIPGLGHVVQGRIAKGLLFFFALNTLFFYGMWLGQWKNVWIGDSRRLPDKPLANFGAPSGLLKDLQYRTEFVGQFWMGIAVWPAIVQYRTSGEICPIGDGDIPPKKHPYLGNYMQHTSEAALNTLQRDGDKRWDLGWVYTVIAGALNVLVIFDALAGPVPRPERDEKLPLPNDGGKPS